MSKAGVFPIITQRLFYFQRSSLVSRNSTNETSDMPGHLDWTSFLRPPLAGCTYNNFRNKCTNASLWAGNHDASTDLCIISRLNNRCCPVIHFNSSVFITLTDLVVLVKKISALKSTHSGEHLPLIVRRQKTVNSFGDRDLQIQKIYISRKRDLRLSCDIQI